MFTEPSIPVKFRFKKNKRGQMIITLEREDKMQTCQLKKNISGGSWVTCLRRSSVRMFSTARTLRRYFSMAASLSEDLGFSALAATRASISLSSEL